jgi:hypothetical protein
MLSWKKLEVSLKIRVAGGQFSWLTIAHCVKNSGQFPTLWPLNFQIIASLSLIDLDRWYAFLCFLEAINDPQVHLRFPQTQINTANEKTEPSFYWPKAETLIIQTTKESSIHLAR